jgi:hypothetical protein
MFIEKGVHDTPPPIEIILDIHNYGSAGKGLRIHVANVDVP